MTSLDEGRPVTAEELAALVPAGGEVLVATDDGTHADYQRVRSFAIAVARSARARLLLLDSTLGAAPGSRPSQRRQLTIDRPLRAWELEALGRAYLLPQIGQAAAASVPALAWLPAVSRADPIADAAEHTDAHLVIVPGSASRVAARYGHAPVAAVDESGEAWLLEDRPAPVATTRIRPRVHLHAKRGRRALS
jgi:hypothetical protein